MKAFLDTNIIVCANDSTDSRKQETALALVATHIRSGTGVISTQVLQEYASTAVQKLKQAHQIVHHQLSLLESLEVAQITPGLIRRAIEIRELYGLSFWDGQIVAAAEFAGCATLVSEDLNHGQFYCGVRCSNPFAPA